VIVLIDQESLENIRRNINSSTYSHQTIDVCCVLTHPKRCVDVKGFLIGYEVISTVFHQIVAQGKAKWLKKYGKILKSEW
jgi:hypothetical protein